LAPLYKAKLANVAATGEPEDQLRAWLEQLIADVYHYNGRGRRAFPPQMTLLDT
jgi:hypothetical protein